MLINTLTDFEGYIRLQLGGGYISRGTIVVELTNEQIDSCIDDAVQYAQQYGFYDSTVEDYIQITLSAGVEQYNVSAIAPDAISMIFLDAGLANMGGPSVLFSPINLLYGGQNPVLGYGGAGGYLQLTSFEVFSQYLSLVNRMFGIEFRLNYNQYTKMLNVSPMPTETMTAVIKVYNKVAAEYLFNVPVIKNLALAKAKKIWARVCMKYTNIDLPGRGNLAAFGESLLMEGREDEERVKKEIKSETGFYGFMIG